MGDHKGRPYIVTNRIAPEKQSHLELSASRSVYSQPISKRKCIYDFDPTHSRRLSVPRPSLSIERRFPRL